jgi:hypothetical protein
MINSVIFLFELELKKLKLSKILPIWKIGVDKVLRINMYYNKYSTNKVLIIILLVIFCFLVFYVSWRKEKKLNYKNKKWYWDILPKFNG